MDKVADMVADMVVDMVADMEVDKVADKVADMNLSTWCTNDFPKQTLFRNHQKV